MCTVTWFVKPEGYEVFFNRDEQKTRAQALLPSIHEQDGVRYIAPIDTDAGGTWIVINEYGVTVCLLNHYQYQQIKSYQSWVSRGAIVQAFASLSCLQSARALFASTDLSNYRAFRMLVIVPSGENVLLIWDGRAPRIETQVLAPKTSSSFEAKKVKHNRKQHFQDEKLTQAVNRESFLAYHASHTPNRSYSSVCMHRDDANTVSFTHIDVSTDQVLLQYTDGAPCISMPGEVIILPKQTQFVSMNTHN